MPFQKGNQLAKRKGKHKKTLEKEALRDVFLEKVRKKWGKIIDAQIEDAMKKYQPRQYLIDQTMGKALDRQSSELEIGIDWDKL